MKGSSRFYKSELDMKSSKRQISAILAERRQRFADLATKLFVAPTTLSSWLNGRHPPPKDFLRKVEEVLRLAPGSLATNGSHQPNTNEK